MSLIFDAALEAELLTLDVRNMLVKWGSHHSSRTGIHASDILVKDSEYCLRKLVLQNLSGEQAEQGEWNWWDWRRSAIFENGWGLHRRIQRLHAKCGNVVWTPVTSEQAEDIRYLLPPALQKYYLRLNADGVWEAAELDLTHYDEDRNIYFSPDMITWFGGEKYVWEIKGLKHEAFSELTDDLEQACSVNETVHKAREQANLYMHLLALGKAALHIENKSNQDFKLWVIEHSEERAWSYTNRMYEVRGRTKLVQAHGTSKLPLRCCQSINDSRARSCPMRNVCFSQEESEEW